jgi:hypothetical protein
MNISSPIVGSFESLLWSGALFTIKSTLHSFELADMLPEEGNFFG